MVDNHNLCVTYVPDIIIIIICAKGFLDSNFNKAVIHKEFPLGVTTEAKGFL